MSNSDRRTAKIPHRNQLHELERGREHYRLGAWSDAYEAFSAADRHVSNIFCKLQVPSRAAATAYAYEHKMI